MAVTIALYNHTTLRFVTGANATGDAYKLELLNNSAVFTASDTTKSQVDNAGAYEISGNGWDVAGEIVTGVTMTSVTTNDAKFDADDLSVIATGGAIGPAYKALLYNATDDATVAFIDFGAAKTADAGMPFEVSWNASGIIMFTYT